MLGPDALQVFGDKAGSSPEYRDCLTREELSEVVSSFADYPVLAARAVGNACFEHKRNSGEVLELGALSFIVDTLKCNDDPIAHKNCCGALANIASTHPHELEGVIQDVLSIISKTPITETVYMGFLFLSNVVSTMQSALLVLPSLNALRNHSREYPDLFFAVVVRLCEHIQDHNCHSEILDGVSLHPIEAIEALNYLFSSDMFNFSAVVDAAELMDKLYDLPSDYLEPVLQLLVKLATLDTFVVAMLDHDLFKSLFDLGYNFKPVLCLILGNLSHNTTVVSNLVSRFSVLSPFVDVISSTDQQLVATGLSGLHNILLFAPVESRVHMIEEFDLLSLLLKLIHTCELLDEETGNHFTPHVSLSAIVEVRLLTRDLSKVVVNTPELQRIVDCRASVQGNSILQRISLEACRTFVELSKHSVVLSFLDGDIGLGIVDELVSCNYPDLRAEGSELFTRLNQETSSDDAAALNVRIARLGL